jgi:hypothetical protein
MSVCDGVCVCVDACECVLVGVREEERERENVCPYDPVGECACVCVRDRFDEALSAEVGFIESETVFVKE